MVPMKGQLGRAGAGGIWPWWGARRWARRNFRQLCDGYWRAGVPAPFFVVAVRLRVGHRFSHFLDIEVLHLGPQDEQAVITVNRDRSSIIVAHECAVDRVDLQLAAEVEVAVFGVAGRVGAPALGWRGGVPLIPAQPG